MRKRILLYICMLAPAMAMPASEPVEDTDSISTVLQEVVVQAPLVRRDADRIVVNVAANPLSANKDAQELLQTAPGVWATDEDISIYGQSGATVYIDDRKVNMSGKQLMTYLKSIQSSSIATIEIIPKGGAEYSADSSGGVIRINLRKRRLDGINGSAGINVTAGEYKQWFNPFLNLGLHSGRWTFNLNGNINGSPSDRYTNHEESTNSAISTDLKGVATHKQKAIQGNISTGVFYEPTDMDKLGLQIDYSTEAKKHISNSRTESYVSDFTGLTLGRYNSRDRFHNLNATFNWSHSLDDEGSLLKLVSNYNYQNSFVVENSEMSWPELPEDSVYSTDNSNRYNIFVTEFSIKKVFTPKWNLNVGGKYTYNNVNNRSFHDYEKEGIWTPNRAYDYDTTYDENIIGLYAIANGEAGRWKFKAGVRGEYSKTVGKHTNEGRMDLFPNVNISCNLTERGDYVVSLGYYRNIRRPSFWSLSPVVRQVSDYFYTVGNPRLVPSFTDALSLDFVLAGKFTIATGYSWEHNPISQMFTANPDFPDRMYLSWDNIGEERDWYIHGDGFLNLTKWWNLYASATYMLTSRKTSPDETFETLGYLRLVLSTTFTLPKEFAFTVNCFYNTRMKIGNIIVYPILNINPTLQKRFGKRWSVSLGLENMLQRKNKLRTVSSGYDRLSQSKSFVTVKIGVTYNFNSGKSFRTPRIEKNSDNSRLSKE